MKRWCPSPGARAAATGDTRPLATVSRAMSTPAGGIGAGIGSSIPAANALVAVRARAPTRTVRTRRERRWDMKRLLGSARSPKGRGGRPGTSHLPLGPRNGAISPIWGVGSVWDMGTATCTFCAVAADEVEASFVWSDDDFVAFLDVRPLFKGHVLLVPRLHVETLPDLPAGLRAGFLAAQQRLAQAMVDG